MELIKVGEKTYYIKNPTNIGIYKIDENNVYLIDSGNDKDAGKKILKIIEEQGWNVKGIITTHSNADHIGGNKVIQDRTNCEIFAYNIEKSFTENPILEPSFLYGGYPFKDITNKFLLAKESKVTNIENNLPDGLDYFTLRGHFFDMIGIKTSDDVYFLADSLFSEKTITKYHLFFIYDVKEFINTLNYLSNLNGKIFIPSHIEATKDISDLIELNRNKVNEIIEKICTYCIYPKCFEEILKYIFEEYKLIINKNKVQEILNKIYDICKQEKTFEQILKTIFDEYNLVMNANQYVLVGSTIRSYLSYLYNEEKIIYEFKDNKMIWKQI